MQFMSNSKRKINTLIRQSIKTKSTNYMIDNYYSLFVIQKYMKLLHIRKPQHDIIDSMITNVNKSLDEMHMDLQSRRLEIRSKQYQGTFY